MIIKAMCGSQARVQIKDISSQKGKPVPVTLEDGDELELAETDLVVASRYHGEIYKQEQKGWLRVISEPTRTLFSPRT